MTIKHNHQYPAHEEISEAASENCGFDMAKNDVRVLNAEFNRLLAENKALHEIIESQKQTFDAMAAHCMVSGNAVVVLPAGSKPEIVDSDHIGDNNKMASEDEIVKVISQAIETIPLNISSTRRDGNGLRNADEIVRAIIQAYEQIKGAK